MKKYLGTLLSVMLFAVFAGNAFSQNNERLILVSGATGTQGGAVVDALLEKGFPVRAMTRNPDSDRAQALAGKGAEVVQGDFDDDQSLDNALDGVYGAYSVQQWRGIGTDAEIRQGKAFADAAKRAGVSHFVYSSNGSSIEITGLPHFDSKLEIENHIRSIDIPYTIIGPRGFMSNVQRDFASALDTGVIESITPPDNINQYIAPEDIGRFVALAFEDPDNWIGRRLPIAGDEVTNAQLAALLSRITGKNITFRQTPWETVLENTAPEDMQGLEYRMANPYMVDIEALRNDFPWMLTLEEYLGQQEWLTAP